MDAGESSCRSGGVSSHRCPRTDHEARCLADDDVFIVSFEPLLADYFLASMKPNGARGPRAWDDPGGPLAALRGDPRRGVVLPFAVADSDGLLDFRVSENQGCSSILKASPGIHGHDPALYAATSACAWKGLRLAEAPFSLSSVSWSAIVSCKGCEKSNEGLKCSVWCLLAKYSAPTLQLRPRSPADLYVKSPYYFGFVWDIHILFRRTRVSQRFRRGALGFDADTVFSQSP